MEPSTPDRRQFGMAAVALAATALAGPAADDPDERPLVVTGQALAETIRSRFGKHLTETQLGHVKRAVFRGLARAELLRVVPLTNADGLAVASPPALP